MKTQIYTFGYEGLGLDEFLRQLQALKIDCVIDVRAVPLSRKKGFSKKALSLALADVGIDYKHTVEMGCPKPIRDKYRENGKWSEYSVKFLAYLAGQSEIVEALSKSTVKLNCCLICFEEDFNLCHRTFVARAISKMSGQNVQHIMDRRVIPDPLQRIAA